MAPTEVIGEYSTRFPYAEYRNTNLSRAANSVNGTVVLPGEIFSLNDTLGPRTAANGYVDGYVINGGRLVKEAGGGISQAATTLYNAGFFAGYEDVEHKPHSLYFDRYPAGREATIYYGVLDMRFRNDTKYPAIIQGSVTKAELGKPWHHHLQNLVPAHLHQGGVHRTGEVRLLHRRRASGHRDPV